MRGGKRGQQQVAEAIAMESANRLITRRTLDRIKAIATGEYKPEDAKDAEEAAEGEEKTEEASATKGPDESAEAKVEGKAKAKKSTSKKSTATKSKSTSKKTTAKKTEEVESE